MKISSFHRRQLSVPCPVFCALQFIADCFPCFSLLSSCHRTPVNFIGRINYFYGWLPCLSSVPFITPVLLSRQNSHLQLLIGSGSPAGLVLFFPLSPSDDFTPLLEAHRRQPNELGMKIGVQTPPHAWEMLPSLLWLSVHAHPVLILISSAWLSLCRGKAKILILLALTFAPLSSAGFSSDGSWCPFVFNVTSPSLLRGQGSCSFRFLTNRITSFKTKSQPITCLHFCLPY